MTLRVLALASGTTTAEDHRHGLSTFMAPAGVLNARPGIIPTVGAADLVAASAMQATVTPFYAWIDGTAATLQGGYPVCLDAPETLTFADGEPGVARVDRVIGVVRHDAYDASGATAGTVEVLKGQANGAPAALPPSALPLWDVTVPAGASAGTGGIPFGTARADRRTYTTAAGGLLPITGTADRPTNPYEGLGVYRLDLDQVEVFDGATWRRLGQLDGPRGIVALRNNLPDSAEADATAEVIVYTLSFTAAAGRCYRVTLAIPRADKGIGTEAAAPAGTVGALRASLRWATGPTVTPASAGFAYTQANLFRDDINFAGGLTVIGHLNNPPGGQLTVGVGIRAAVANTRGRCFTEGFGQFSVEDIGRNL